MRIVRILALSVALLLLTAACSETLTSDVTYLDVWNETTITADENLADVCSVSNGGISVRYSKYVEQYTPEYAWLEQADTVAQTLLGEEATKYDKGIYGSATGSLTVTDQLVSFTADSTTIAAIKQVIPYTSSQYDSEWSHTTGISKDNYTEVQVAESTTKTRYYGFQDLDFASFETALSDVTGTLGALGLDTVALEQAYVLDCATMNANLEKLRKASTDAAKEFDGLVFTTAVNLSLHSS